MICSKHLPSVPLEGVPTLPDDVLHEIKTRSTRWGEEFEPTPEQEARAAEAIAAAMAELRRRHGWPDEPEVVVPVHVHEFGERPALRRKRSSEA